MTLHIFNPENDLALACFEPHFIPPRSARVMADDLSVLPAWWAKEGDAVCVASVGEAARIIGLPEGALCPRVRWVSREDCAGYDCVRPWGWSPLLVNRLCQGGCDAETLPDETELRCWRGLSGRRHAVELLSFLTGRDSVLGREWSGFLCGRSSYCTDEGEIVRLLGEYPETILKAPWSGSGKGLRLGRTGFVPPLSGWCRRLLREQGAVVVEPLYDKVCDFALEFETDGGGGVSYRGLSLFFTTHQGAYAGNRVAAEQEKERWMLRHIPAGMFAALREELQACIGRVFAGSYRGPLGVDMMLCRVPGRNRLCVHPCVEVNLRRTMGLVAVDLARYVAPGSEGRFVIDFFKDGNALCADTERLVGEHPLRCEEGRVVEGVLRLTPVTEHTHYRAVLHVMRRVRDL